MSNREYEGSQAFIDSFCLILARTPYLLSVLMISNYFLRMHSVKGAYWLTSGIKSNLAKSSCIIAVKTARKFCKAVSVTKG